MILKRLMIVVMMSVVVHIYAADDQEQANRELFKAFQDDAPFETIMTLVENGADLKSIEARAGWSNALHYAVTSRSEDSSLMCCLIEKYSVDVNGKDWEHSTPCHIAAAYDKASFIEILHQKGADINAKNREGYTPLHFACTNSASKAVEALLQCGANREIKNNVGETPAENARKRGDKEIADFIENYQDPLELKEPENFQGYL